MKSKYIYMKILNTSKKIKSIEYLGGKCKNCDNSKWYHLEFHHTHHKDDLLSTLINGGYRWSIIKKELDKCILLCANCHQEHHFTERNSKDNRQISKQVYLSYKGNTCEECGYDKCQASLSFHHIDPDIKEFQFSNLNERISSINELKTIIKNELDKCSLLCFNCHKEKHIDINFYEENKIEILEKSKNLKELSKPVNINDVINMYLSGMKQVDIRKKLNVAKSTISGVIKKYKKGIVV